METNDSKLVMSENKHSQTILWKPFLSIIIGGLGFTFSTQFLIASLPFITRQYLPDVIRWCSAYVLKYIFYLSKTKDNFHYPIKWLYQNPRCFSDCFDEMFCSFLVHSFFIFLTCINPFTDQTWISKKKITMKLVLSLRNQICTLLSSEYPTIASVIE